MTIPPSLPPAPPVGDTAFTNLDPADQDLFLTYLKTDRIEDAHPRL
jgi:hypothetical protein